MKVLLIGNGGREHAIAWKLSQSPEVKTIHSTPFNPGIARLGKCADIPVEDLEGLLKYAEAGKFDFTVVGPEIPLSLGIVDRFRSRGKKIFGPTQAAARIESSKGFAKDLMARYGIPTAEYRRFSSPDGLDTYIRSFKTTPVIKADGLAAGKGVIVAKDRDEALREAKDMLSGGKFGSAGASIVVEERMSGPEASVFAVTDGKNFRTFAAAQDHKRAFDGDQGPNTGGMGAYAPARIVTPRIQKEIDDKIIRPAIDGMAKEGCPYTGVLYAGLMLTEQGPRVIEFNCRFGDPETQVVLPLLGNDLLDVLLASAEGTVDRLAVKTKPGAAVSVVLASGGYPGSYARGKVITGIEEAEKSGAIVFHAGTKEDGGRIVTAGGRVLNVAFLGKDLKDAIAGAYQAAEKINFENKMMRTDIGRKGL